MASFDSLIYAVRRELGGSEHGLAAGEVNVVEYLGFADSLDAAKRYIEKQERRWIYGCNLVTSTEDGGVATQPTFTGDWRRYVATPWHLTRDDDEA